MDCLAHWAPGSKSIVQKLDTCLYFLPSYLISLLRLDAALLMLSLSQEPKG